MVLSLSLSLFSLSFPSIDRCALSIATPDWPTSLVSVQLTAASGKFSLVLPNPTVDVSESIVENWYNDITPIGEEIWSKTGSCSIQDLVLSSHNNNIACIPFVMHGFS